MTIEGYIVDVMESWPLQLRVKVNSNFYHVLLNEDTVVRRLGKNVSQKELEPEMRVLIKGKTSIPTELSVTAQNIEIL